MKQILLILPWLCCSSSPVLAGDVAIRLSGTVDQDSYTSGPMVAAGLGSVVEVRFEVDLPGLSIQPGVNTAYDIDRPTFQISVDGVFVNGMPPPNALLGVVNNGPTNDEILTGPMALSNGDFLNLGLAATGTLYASDDLTAILGLYPLASSITSDAFQFSGAGGFLGLEPDTLEISLVGQGGNSFCYGDGGDQAGCTNCPCGNNAPVGTAGGCLNSVATSAGILQTGAPSLANDTLRFSLRRAVPNTFAILTSGDARAPAGAANPCFGTGAGIVSSAFDGLRCVVQNVQRHGTRMTNPNGDAGVTTPGWGFFDPPTIGLIAQGGFVSGQTRHYQIVYRDIPTGGCGTGQNTTPGVTVTFGP